MMHYGAWEGSDLAQGLIFEELAELRYELLGPHSYDTDFKRELRESGEWEAEKERWTPPDKERGTELRHMIAGMRIALELCERASQICKNMEDG